uniref:hypothetical protein n=1 Tax=Candidatus Thiodubiliella endoseptemdiera TaxID=2738886 RepID=UPI0034DEDEF8
MGYRENSKWNEENEIRCLIIFKKLKEKNFPHGKQAEYCKNMSGLTNLDTGNISAKICNYKSIAGINKPSNASQNTKDTYEKYKNHTVKELENLI